MSYIDINAVEMKLVALMIRLFEFTNKSMNAQANK